MMRNLVSIFALGAVLVAATPAAAQNRGATTRVHHRTTSANVLRARIASLDARIAMLRDQRSISREEALDLRDLSRSLQRQLHGMSNRDARDIEFDLDRLERRILFATDDARWGSHVYGNERDLHVDRDRYKTEHNGDYKHFDRYTGSPVDRWHDPFDRGGGL